MRETPENIANLVARVAQKRDANLDSEFVDDEFDFMNEGLSSLQAKLVTLDLVDEDSRQIAQSLLQLNSDYVAYNRLTPNLESIPSLQKNISDKIPDPNVRASLILDARRGFIGALRRLDGKYQ